MTQTSTQAVATATNQTSAEAAIPQANMSERFMQKILSEYTGRIGEIRIADYQRRLIQGYFIGVDRALGIADDERIRKNKGNSDHKWDNNTPVTWANVNLNDLALDVVHYARLGLDMMQANFITPIPYFNKKTSKYDINLMLGYNGIKYIAEMYALTPPKSVTIELVYATDKFIPHKRGMGCDVESYTFDITSPFDRGEIVGGFGYVEYDDPRKNELVIMSTAAIMKRKPKYASANFWGGKAKEWENGKRVEVEKEGWLDEMCRKTLIREVYSPKHILLDPRKVDDSYMYMRQREAQFEAAQDSIRQTIDVTANTTPIEEAVAKAAAGREAAVPGLGAPPAPSPAGWPGSAAMPGKAPGAQPDAPAGIGVQPGMLPQPPAAQAAPTEEADAAGIDLYAGMSF